MRIIIGALALLSSTAAQADLSATYGKGGEKLIIEANDDGRVRLNAAEQGQYTLLTGDGAFIVFEEGGIVKVAAMADFQAVLDEMMSAMWGELGADPAELGQEELARTGEAMRMEAVGEEVVNGRAGAVYREILPEADEQAEDLAEAWGVEPARAAEIVLSDDPALAPLGEAWSRMVRLVPTFGRVLAGGPTQEQDALASLLKGKGVLRMDDITLETVAFEPIADERFALPSAPMSKAEVKAMLEKSGE